VREQRKQHKEHLGKWNDPKKYLDNISEGGKKGYPLPKNRK
jgi:hypothetical protein